ncbi:hypothetical protein ACEPAG_6085 [Sanghuangporus baumii]
MNAPTSTDNRATERLDTPPSYQGALNDEASTISESGARPSNSIFKENKFGEMRPVDTGNDFDSLPQQKLPTPSKTVYSENQYGELHREETDPDLIRQQLHPVDYSGDGFGRDTRKPATALGPDKTYPENRFGELGRADTFYPHEHTHLTDKLKGMAEHVVDKLTGHHHHHSPPPQEQGNALKSEPVE